MADKAWKAFERRVARFFSTTRNALSGGNSKVTRSDSLHARLFIECKQRKKHSVVTLWDDTKKLADKENKTPVVVLSEKGRPGFWVMCHSSDVELVLHYAGHPATGYICHDCAQKRGAVWPEGHGATQSPGKCPECLTKRPLCSVDDWDWPEGSCRPAIGAGRD